MASQDPAGSAASASRVSAKEMRMQQIDGVIQQKMDAIMAFKVERNKCAPISTLPTEIMIIIFIMIKQDTNKISIDTHSKHLRRRWLQSGITVSHVCSAWRKLALGIIELWTDPPFWNVSWAEEMIRRSKGAPLTVRYNFHEEKTMKSRYILQETLRRGKDIMALYINGLSHDTVDILPTHLPRVTEVELIGRDAPIPISIFSEAIKLTSLALDSCSIDWVSYLPPSITSLRLGHVRPASTSTFAQLLDALHRLPLLQDLKLDYSIEAFWITEYPLPPIKLPRLQYLHILSTVEYASMFFCHVIPPPNILSLYLETKESTVNPNDQNFAVNTRIMLAVIARIYLDKSCSISFCTLSSVSSTDIAFKFASGYGHTLYLSIAYAYNPIPPDIITEILTTLFSSGLPTNDIKTVDISSLRGDGEFGPLFSPSDLAQSLGRLPNVSHVVASSYQAWNLLEAIQMPADEKKLYFNNLSVLSLRRMNFSTIESDEDEKQLFDELQDCLMCRYEYGAEITQLILENCWQLDGYMVLELKQIVADIDWDHLERGFNTSSESSDDVDDDSDEGTDDDDDNSRDEYGTP